jgi:putative lipoprotein
MAKKFFSLMFTLLALTLAVSCSDDNEEVQLSTLTIQLTSSQPVSDYSDFKVNITDLKSGSIKTIDVNAAGNAVVSLPLGSYNFTAENPVDGASTMYGHIENFMLSAATATVEIKVESIVNSLEKTFVLDELYFNGDCNGDWDNIYYESYLTITNVSNRPLYADGLSIAICGDYNSLESADGDPMPAYLKQDSIVITQLYSIPGDGHTYKVNPGESLVLAHTAINNKVDENGNLDPTKTYSIDLSGADFEFYVPYEYCMTTDNPEVPNMIVDYSMNQAFNWGYSGSTPIMLVRLDADRKARMIADKVNLSIPVGYGSMMMDHLLLPVSSVIDGVETGSVDNLFRKVLPDRVDRGAVLINSGGLYGGFDGQFVKRKRTTDANGNQVICDTNNSYEDFEVIEHGQKSYPKK